MGARRAGLDTLIDDLVALAERLGIPKLDDPRDRVYMLVTHLAQLESPWLLVFDNAVAETDIAPYVPDGGGMVLVTNRNRSFDRLGHVTQVGVLTDCVAEAFLRDRVRKNNRMLPPNPPRRPSPPGSADFLLPSNRPAHGSPRRTSTPSPATCACSAVVDVLTG